MSWTRRRVQLYHQARTAHLERLLELPDTTLVYTERRYDFDPGLAARVDARLCGPAGIVRMLATSPIDVLEVTEPGYLPGIRTAVVGTLAARVGALVARRRRPVVVTYAIGNSDPRSERQARGLRQHLGKSLDVTLAHVLARLVDRVAFGTEGARATYVDLFGPARGRQQHRLVPALPAVCECVDVGTPPQGVLFLGAFVERKGLPLVLAAWPDVRDAVPGATLRLVGTGRLVDDAHALAERDGAVSVLVDPPRATIHEALRAAAVVVLPSQASPTWREQVGLPVLEALQHGCTVVTTDQTGLASWLADHGHTVLPSDATAAELAGAVAGALREPLDRDQVLASLPAQDGRLAADSWLADAAPRP